MGFFDSSSSSTSIRRTSTTKRTTTIQSEPIQDIAARGLGVSLSANPNLRRANVRIVQRGLQGENVADLVNAVAGSTTTAFLAGSEGTVAEIARATTGTGTEIGTLARQLGPWALLTFAAVSFFRRKP